jgi:ATP-binding cassette subfamily C protein
MIQMEAVECGAASLGIVLGYYGCYLSLEELRLKCGVSRNGVNAYNILEAAKSYGMDAEGYRASVEDLRKLSMPAILFWNQNHFLVLEGINRGDLVFLNDPAAGRYSLSIKEFTQRYSGIVLTLTPSADFRKRGKPQSLVKGIFHRLRPFGDALIYLFLVQVCVLALALTLPALFRLFLDKILGENQLSWQWEFIGVFVGVAMLTGLLTWMKEIFLNVLRVRLGIHFSAEFLWHILKLPIVFFTQRSAGEVIYRMKLNTNVANVLTSQVAITLVNMLLIGVYVVIMFQYDALIASFGILICGINCAMLVIVGKFRANAYARVQQEQAKTIAISFDTLGSMETVKCAGNSDFFFSRIIGAYTRNINTGQEIAKRDTWLFTLAAFTQQASTILLLGIGVWRVMEGSLTIGMLIGLQILLSGFLSPIMSLLTFGSKLQSFEVDLNRLNDVLLQPPDPLTQERHSPSRSPADSNTNPELEFSEVVFGYSPLSLTSIFVSPKDGG